MSLLYSFLFLDYLSFLHYCLSSILLFLPPLFRVDYCLCLFHDYCLIFSCALLSLSSSFFLHFLHSLLLLSPFFPILSSVSSFLSFFVFLLHFFFPLPFFSVSLLPSFLSPVSFLFSILNLPSYSMFSSYFIPSSPISFLFFYRPL